MNVFEKIILKPGGAEPLLIVEMSGNHGYSLEHAKKFVQQVHHLGGKCVKFQVYTPDTITLNSDSEDFKISRDNEWHSHQTLYQLYQKAYTPWDWITELVVLCEDLGLSWLASPFDETAIEFLESLNCTCYKIASPEITDTGLIAKAASTGKPVILSTGVATIDDLDLAVDTIRRYHEKFAILKCTTAYPAPINELNLRAIGTLQQRFRCATGLSDHTLDNTALICSIALGAKIVEKHFKLDGDVTSIDNHFSIELSQLPEILKLIKATSDSLGVSDLVISPSAKLSLAGKRSLYPCKKIAKGETFSEENIKSVRPSYGLHPSLLPSIIGCIAARDIEMGERLALNDVEGLNEDQSS